MRTVQFDSGVTEKIVRIYGGPERADDALAAIEWILSRDPGEGSNMGSGFWALRHGGIGMWQELIFYYDFTSTEVRVHCVLKPDEIVRRSTLSGPG